MAHEQRPLERQCERLDQAARLEFVSVQALLGRCTAVRRGSRRDARGACEVGVESRIAAGASLTFGKERGQSGRLP